MVARIAAREVEERGELASAATQLGSKGAKARAPAKDGETAASVRIEKVGPAGATHRIGVLRRHHPRIWAALALVRERNTVRKHGFAIGTRLAAIGA